MPDYQFPHSTPQPPIGEGDDPGVKTTKADANYRPAGNSDTNCGTCAHYQGTGICNVVAGVVDTAHVSDMWTPRRSKLTDLIS